MTQSAEIMSTVEVTLPAATVATDAYTASDAMKTCAAISTTCAATGSIASVPILTDGSALPSWITSTVDSGAYPKISIAAIDSDDVSSSFVVKVTYTPTTGNGSAVTYDAVTITLTAC